MTEIWKSVIGFEGLYEVSNLSRVRRVGAAHGAKRGRVLKDQPNRGYRSVQLWKNDKPKTCLVHVLVAEAFIGPKPDGHEVNHDDGKKTNNIGTNLEWMTRSQNMKHAYATGLRSVTDKQRYAHARWVGQTRNV